MVRIILNPNSSARNKELDFYFETLEIKNRSSMGNQVTKYPIKNVKLKEAGKSTISGRKLWFDDNFGRLNEEEKGGYLGSFESDDKLLVIYTDGSYEITGTELTQRFDAEKVVSIGKFDPEKIITAIYLDNEKMQYNVKRFRIETTTLGNKYMFIKEGDGNRLEIVTSEPDPVVLITSGRGSQAKTQKIKLGSFVEIMGWRAVGAKLFDYNKTVSMDWEVKKKKGDNQPELF